METVSEGQLEAPRVIGRTAGVFQVGTKQKAAYFTCDGGLKNPLENGIVRLARIVRVNF